MTLRLKGSTSGHTEVKAPASAGSNTITLPTGNGSAEQFLKNSGTAGELEFSSMVETSTGVGIGTSSPQSKLSVGNGASTDSGLSITFTGDNSTLAKFFANTATGEVTIGGVASNYFPTFHSNGSERMRIDTSGRLLVGTTTARAGVTVALGSNSIPASGASTAAAVFSNATDGAVYGVNIGANTSGLGYIQSQRTDGNATTYDLVIQPNGGNVGIGTSSPTRKLHVAESANNDVATFINSDSTNGYGVNIRAGGTASGRYALRVANDANAVVLQANADGKVGIGTSSPSHGLLTLSQSASSAFNALVIQQGNTGSAATDGLHIGIDSAVDAYIMHKESRALAFGTANTERMRIDSSGNVGIGTTSVDFSDFGSNTGGFAVQNIGGTNTGIKIGDGTNDNYLVAAGNGNYYQSHYGSGHMIFGVGTSGTERMRIDSSGVLTVGSGANTATQRAAFLGGYTTFENSAGTGNPSITFNNDTDTGFLNPAGNTLAFNTGGSERMRIDTSGNVLVGKTAASVTSGTGVELLTGSGASVDVVINAASNISVNHLYNINATNNGYRFYLAADGGIRNFSGNNVNLSDEREKKNIVDMDSTWSELKQWTLRQFHFNGQDDFEDKCYGVIAQQIEIVSPQVLSTFETNPTTTRKGVKEQKMMWMAIKALQEAQARIETLEQRLSDAGIA